MHSLPPTPEWVPLKDIIEILHHPDFYWGSIPDAKYIELRIDTRDNCCLVKDRNGKPLKIEHLRQAIDRTYVKGMNENVPDPSEMIELPEGAAKILHEHFEELSK